MISITPTLKTGRERQGSDSECCHLHRSEFVPTTPARGPAESIGAPHPMDESLKTCISSQVNET
jgi:hypothetical protein